MNDLLTLLDLISDPINGPFEGEEYSIDEDGNIQVAENNVRLAATIMRKANSSELFESSLVKIGQKGDSIILGFDTVSESAPVFTKVIGKNNEVTAEVKKNENGTLCIYLNKKRNARSFATLPKAKRFINLYEKELLSVDTNADSSDDNEESDD